MDHTIPIIQLHGTLILSIQIDLSDRLVQELKDNIAREIRRRAVKGLVIEVSGVGVFDSYMARAVRDLAQLAKLMGVRTVIAGLNAGVAITLVEMGALTGGLQTTRALEEAVALLDELSEEDSEALDYEDETSTTDHLA